MSISTSIPASTLALLGPGVLGGGVAVEASSSGVVPGAEKFL